MYKYSLVEDFFFYKNLFFLVENSLVCSCKALESIIKFSKNIYKGTNNIIII